MQQRLKEICIVRQLPMNNCHGNYMNGPDISTDTRSDRLIDLCLRDAFHDLFCAFVDFYASATRDAEVTK